METSEGGASREAFERLAALDRPRGAATRRLVIGPLAVTIEGLDRALAVRLDERWGAFAGPRGDAADPLVRVFQSDDRWLHSPAGEPYRIDAAAEGNLVVAERFALAREDATRWRAGVTELPGEPVDRIVENVLRLLLARLAIEAGGFALHAATVARDGVAYMFTGPSGAGKSTAVRLAAPAASMGDDYGIVLPCVTGGWLAPGVPFDNAERPPAPPPPGGVLPLAGVWRLEQAGSTWIERPPRAIALATLLGCAVAPWTMADLSSSLLAHAASYVGTGSYAHLHFTKDAELWNVLVESR